MLANWASLFQLLEMVDSRCTSKSELEELNNFTEKAANHKTLKKLSQSQIKVKRYNAITLGNLLLLIH